MQIYFIPPPVSHYFSLESTPNETVKQRKEKISQYLHVDPKYIHLFFNFFVNELDSNALQKEFSQVRVVSNLPTDIICVFISGDSILDVNVKTISILIRSIPYTTFAFNVESSLKILDLKKLIENESEIPLKSQSLYFNGNMLKDSSTLENSGIQSGDEIRLIDGDLETINISITLPSKKVVNFDVCPNETGEFIREKLAETEGYSYFLQKLRSGVKNLKEKDSLDSIGIKNDGKLTLALASSTDEDDKCVIIVELPSGEVIRYNPLFRIPLIEQKEFVKYFTKMGTATFSRLEFFYDNKVVDVNLSMFANEITRFPAKLVLKKINDM
ncbi:hypothetical protein TRFO_25902 [Tritrichomonas foetus]|uniref:Ubiquitin-like domain-containing protein n=1 Tax=Tritrichomonas foetus TaxID=1144522 RepID=A0A1J4K4L0_9EUKA|nr:hypothetical protein TRFO_25902 [Tritrichomonas foetus]|eukprot:OHT06131.1 hypothetical protein TRFO_25902 [Tritrichomonas foetus]